MKHLFFVGSARSGTTWLERLLGRHPQVVTLHEAHVFPRYVAALRDVWSAEARSQPVGLCRILDDGQFDGLCRDLVLGIYRTAAAKHPGAEVVIDKTPANAYHGTEIRRLIPDAYFLHVVRDPRDVVCSLNDGARGFAARWSTEDPVEAARRWCGSVGRSLELRAAAGDRYLETRYERLHERGPDELARIFAWLGLPSDRALCEAAIEACSFEKMSHGNGGPGKFFRRGVVGSFKEEISRGDLECVEYVAGGLMETLGYPRETVSRTVPPLRMRVRSFLVRLSRILRRRRTGSGQRPMWRRGRRRRQLAEVAGPA